MKFLSLLLTLSLSAFTLQAQHQHLLHKSYAQRLTALDTAFYAKVATLDSTAFFAKLAAVARLALKKGDKELLLETEILRGEYYTVGKQGNNLLVLPTLLAAKKTADNHSLVPLQIKARQKLGHYYFFITQSFGPGFENYLESYELMKDLSVDQIPDKQELVANIGTAFYTFGDLISARKYFKEALFIKPSSKKRQAINLTNTLGLLLMNQKKYDSAHYYFTKAYAMAEATSDSAWIGIVAGNQAIIYYYQKKYDLAIPLLQLDINQSIKAKEIDSAVNGLTTLAHIRMIQGQYAEANELTKKAISLLNKTGEPTLHLKDIFQLLAAQNKQKGNLELAYLFADSSRIMNDSIHNRRKAQFQLAAENKIEMEKYRTEALRIKHDENLRTSKIIAIILAIALLSLVVILYINSQRVLLIHKQKKLQSEKQKMETELNLARLQLNNFTDSIREKNQLIEQYSAEIKRKVSLQDEPDLEERKQTVQQLLQATLLTDEQWKEFTVLFDKVHTGFLHRLKDKMPNLSPADTRYVVLNKLNLAPKEMASMLGVRPDAIRLYKHRLRKKLELTEADSLEELLSEI